jgi:type IV secretion system protein VirB6
VPPNVRVEAGPTARRQPRAGENVQRTLFILCLAWRPTVRFFDSWLSMVLNAVVLTWFAFFALGLSAYMGAAMFKAISDGGGFLGSAFNVLGESTRYCVLMVLMAIICFQAPSLASALTGGAAIQQGVHMVQNALMVAGLRSAVSARGAATAAAGGVIRAGAGLPYLAGRTVATGARTAAYRLAALRGRA